MGNKERLASIEAIVDEAQRTADSLPDAGTGMVLPELDNPGAAGDLVQGKELIDANGQKVTGTLPTTQALVVPELSDEATLTVSNEKLVVSDGVEKTVVENAFVVSVDATPLGDATEADVVAGKIFTSKNGMGKVGTHTCSGTQLPSLSSPGTSEDLLTGKELIGADGSVVTGAMANNGSLARTYTTNGSRTFSKGYYSGGTITVNVPASTVEVNNPYGNASASDVRSGVTFMSGGVERTGTMSDASVSIVVDEQTGKITAFNAVAGYLSGGTKDTEYLTTQAAQTITPGTTDQTISSGTYLTGTQTILGDSNLVSSNIANGVSIFGVTGSYTGASGVKLTVTRSGSTSLTASVGSDVNFIAITRDISSGVPTGGYQVIHLVQYFDDSGNRTGVLVATDGSGDTVTMALGSSVNTTHLQVYISGGTLTVKDNNRYGYIFNGTFTVYGAKI